jgi:hypothetical protein
METLLPSSDMSVLLVTDQTDSCLQFVLSHYQLDDSPHAINMAFLGPREREKKIPFVSFVYRVCLV